MGWQLSGLQEEGWPRARHFLGLGSLVQFPLHSVARHCPSFTCGLWGGAECHPTAHSPVPMLSLQIFKSSQRQSLPCSAAPEAPRVASPHLGGQLQWGPSAGGIESLPHGSFLRVVCWESSNDAPFLLEQSTLCGWLCSLRPRPVPRLTVSNYFVFLCFISAVYIQYLNSWKSKVSLLC